PEIAFQAPDSPVTAFSEIPPQNYYPGITPLFSRRSGRLRTFPGFFIFSTKFFTPVEKKTRLIILFKLLADPV
ncbi:MAG: hypothetical protein K2H29_12840, partial [Oscillospiraceae bacterium]|nr:hypothetical protein [Oscillospiraceae bacterium]